MPLKLSLKPGEAFILNGAVVRNGERRSSLLIETRARILREKDIMQPDQATTPVTRAYFAVMQAYIGGEVEGPAFDHAAMALADLLASVPSNGERDQVIDISRALAAGDAYRALAACRDLMRQLEPEALREAS